MQASRRPGPQGAIPVEVRILLAAATAGSLDLFYVVAINGAAGVSPTLVLQFIASGLLGEAAFYGGYGGAALGASFHFGLMTIFALCVAAIPAHPKLARRSPLIVGAAAGLALYAVMTFVVVPLSRTPPLGPLPYYRTLLDFLVHVVLGGVVALVVRGRSAGPAIASE